MQYCTSQLWLFLKDTCSHHCEQQTNKKLSLLFEDYFHTYFEQLTFSEMFDQRNEILSFLLYLEVKMACTTATRA